MISYDLPPHRGLLWLQNNGPVQVCRVHKLQQFVVEISRGMPLSHMKRHLHSAEQQVSPSNLLLELLMNILMYEHIVGGSKHDMGRAPVAWWQNASLGPGLDSSARISAARQEVALWVHSPYNASP